jgi:hypothetical protein
VRTYTFPHTYTHTHTHTHTGIQLCQESIPALADRCTWYEHGLLQTLTNRDMLGLGISASFSGIQLYQEWFTSFSRWIASQILTQGIHAEEHALLLKKVGVVCLLQDSRVQEWVSVPWCRLLLHCCTGVVSHALFAGVKSAAQLGCVAAVPDHGRLENS